MQSITKFYRSCKFVNYIICSVLDAAYYFVCFSLGLKNSVLLSSKRRRTAYKEGGNVIWLILCTKFITFSPFHLEASLNRSLQSYSGWSFVCWESTGAKRKCVQVAFVDTPTFFYYDSFSFWNNGLAWIVWKLLAVWPTTPFSRLRRTIALTRSSTSLQTQGFA